MPCRLRFSICGRRDWVEPWTQGMVMVHFMQALVSFPFIFSLGFPFVWLIPRLSLMDNILRERVTYFLSGYILDVHMSVLFAGHDSLPAMNLVITYTYQFMRTTTTNQRLLPVFFLPLPAYSCCEGRRTRLCSNYGLVVVSVTTLSTLCFDGGR